VKTVAVVTVEEQTRLLLCTAHLPLLELRVKPVPEGVAVKVAHVPPMYQVPPLMIQPSVLPPYVTGRVPDPEKGVPGAVVGPPPVGVVVVVVGAGEPPLFGKYLTPVAGQFEVAPPDGSQSMVIMQAAQCYVLGLTGTKVPDCTLPFTS